MWTYITPSQWEALGSRSQGSDNDVNIDLACGVCVCVTLLRMVLLGKMLRRTNPFLSIIMWVRKSMHITDTDVHEVIYREHSACDVGFIQGKMQHLHSFFGATSTNL